MRDRSGVPVGGRRVTSPSLVIVGNPGEVHVGRHLLHAAGELSIAATLCDTSTAYSGSRVRRTLNWRLRGHRPANITAFSRHVVAECQKQQPTHLIATGLAPIDD